MKFIKTVAVLLAVSVSLMVPSFAWDSDSFVGQDFYFYESVINYAAQSPSLMAAGDTSSDSLTSLDFSQLYPLLSPSSSFGSTSAAVLCRVFHEEVPSWTTPSGQVIPGVPAYYESRPYPYPDYVTLRPGGSNYQLILGSLSVPSELNGGEVQSIQGIVFTPILEDEPNYTMFYDMDLSSLGDFYTFSVSGVLDFQWNLYQFPGASGVPASSMSLYVNGDIVKTFYKSDSNLIEVESYIYDSPVPIQSISFSFTLPTHNYDYYSGSFVPYVIFSSRTDFTFDILSGSSALGGQNDATQSDINEVDGLEAEWGNSMTENFNALSLDTFTYPDGLTSGFALISGIFQDLWNAMGSYSILYVLPLTLAVVLLLIGRISKFAGQGRSSPSKEE